MSTPIKCNKANEMRENSTATALAGIVVGISESDEHESREEDAERQRDIFSCLCGRIFSRPCTLPCGHTMCKSCLLKSDFICSTCGVDVNLTRDTISVNVLLYSIVEKLYPKHCAVEKLITLGKEQEVQGNLDNAIEKLSMAKSICPNDVTVLNARSAVFTKAFRFDEALIDAQTAVDVDPCNAYSYFCFGSAYAGLNQLDEAIGAYSSCLEFALDDAELCGAVSNEMEKLLSRSCDENTTETIPSYKLKRSHKDSSLSHDRDAKRFRMMPLKCAPVSVEDVRCSLCLEVLFHPITTLCGHSFCKSCLTRWLDYQAICPCCRAPQHAVVAQQSVDVTSAIEDFLRGHFSVQYSQMQETYDEKMKKSARVGLDQLVEVPIIICMAAFPSLNCPLNIFEPKYRGMLRECLESGSKRFGTCALTKDGHADTGTILKVVGVKYANDGKAIVTTVGESRFKIIRTVMREDGLMSAFVDYITDDWESVEVSDVEKVKETCASVYKKLTVYYESLKPDARECIARALGDMPDFDVDVLQRPNAIPWLWWAIAALPLHESLKIRFLKSTSFLDRIGSIDRYLQSLLKRAGST